MFGMGIGLALAADEPTVTLTQTELQELLNAQAATSEAHMALKKVQDSFRAPVHIPTRPTTSDDPAPAK